MHLYTPSAGTVLLRDKGYTLTLTVAPFPESPTASSLHSAEFDKEPPFTERGPGVEYGACLGVIDINGRRYFLFGEGSEKLFTDTFFSFSGNTRYLRCRRNLHRIHQYHTHDPDLLTPNQKRRFLPPHTLADETKDLTTLLQSGNFYYSTTKEDLSTRPSHQQSPSVPFDTPHPPSNPSSTLHQIFPVLPTSFSI